MGTAGKVFEAFQASKEAIEQGKEIHGKVMEVHGQIQEFIPSSKDIPRSRSEFLQAGVRAIKQRHEIHSKAKDIHGQVMGIHGQVMDVHGQAMAVHEKLQEAQQQAPKNTPDFKNGAKGYARGCLCGVWTIFKAEAKKYITYVLSLLIFAIIAIGLICFLIPVLGHHAHLQLFTLTTQAKMHDTGRGGSLNAVDGESVDYRIHLLHYCVSGLTSQAEKQFSMQNGCHYSMQALYDHIIPALGTTFTPPLPGKDVPGPSTDIKVLFKHFGYISLCLYILDIILAPIVAGGFIWWFISTLRPWKRIFRAFLCFFTATLFIPAVLQTLIVYRTIYILGHHIDLTTSSLDITLKPNVVYLFCIHLFWCLLLLNVIVFRLIDCCRRKSKMRKIRQAHEITEARENQDFHGKVYVGQDGNRDVLYETDHYQSVGLQKLAPFKESTGIARKHVEIVYENGDLEKGN